MNLEKIMSDLENHIDSAAYEFSDLRREIEVELKDLHEEIRDLRDIREILEEQNELLEEQVEDLNRKNAIFELENMELKLRIEVYELDI